MNFARRLSNRRVGLLLGAVVVLVLVLLVLVVRRKVTRWCPAVPPSQRAQTLSAMAARPGDYWPRGVGHVVLAWPGSREEDKGYLEPGGSFSPGVGTFGITLGIADNQGKLITGDTVRLQDIQQRFTLPQNPSEPLGIATTTPIYSSIWTTSEVGRYNLEITPKNLERGLFILVRSVGPAGGPVSKLRFDGEKLWLNERWHLSTSPQPSSLLIGEEPRRADAKWLKVVEPARSGEHLVNSESGWGFARLNFQNASQIRAVVRDTWPKTVPSISCNRQNQVEVHLPDGRFVDSLVAQVAHLSMSLVRNETRPGEPTNYPLEWLRDGAYVIVSLARVGYVELARTLVTRFAGKDFFGGFGPEGDNLAFALWALEEVDHAMVPQSLARENYPHVFRKAQAIERLLRTREPVFALPIESAIVPAVRDSWRLAPTLSLVAYGERDGMIAGRMDLHVPLLFINAINYMGLLRAARLAERVSDEPAAERWRKSAAELRIAWHRNLKTSERDNERTAIAAMWPSFVAGSDRKQLLELLRARNSARSKGKSAIPWPSQWSYFDVAEMHQWLLLGDIDALWSLLNYYLNHSSSPGLFTWGEGTSEENSFGLWKNVRGWVTPGPVTPHYWTAAEMLLLQLEMLAYVDETDESAPRWVIGGGVPREWVKQPLSVKRVGTSRGRVDWVWNPDLMTMTATVTGHVAPVALGPAFPTGARLDVRFTGGG